MNRHTRSRRLAALLAGALAVLAGEAAAAQQSDEGPRSVVVRYADLNLGSNAGARAMLGRIEEAADRACGGGGDLSRLDRRMLYSHCKAATVDRAVRSLDAPLVTAMVNHTGAATVLAQR